MSVITKNVVWIGNINYSFHVIYCLQDNYELSYVSTYKIVCDENRKSSRFTIHYWRGGKKGKKIKRQLYTVKFKFHTYFTWLLYYHTSHTNIPSHHDNINNCIIELVQNKGYSNGSKFIHLSSTCFTVSSVICVFFL